MTMPPTPEVHRHPAPERRERPLLELVGVRFARDGRSVLQGVDFQLRDADRVALVGANGAGKTTLLHSLVGLIRPDAGEVMAFGRPCRAEPDFRSVRARVGLLFQHSDDQLFCPTVLDDVAFGPLNLGRAPAEARAVAERTLAALGLTGFADRVTHRLSSGEKRLVALATVLAMEPEVLLLDEPTNGLDENTEARLIGHLAELDQAMVVVSHDRRFLEQLVNRAVVLRHGVLTEAELHRHPHRHEHVHLHIHVPGDDAAHAHDAPVPPHADHHAAEGESGPAD
jgi:cobalt/nickel transport system ATP-binding protein